MTLIEIMIVVVIMALVATGIGMAVLPALDRARIRRAEVGVQTVRSSVILYRADNPSDCPSMAQLVETRLIDDGTSSKDPWDREFVIDCSDGSTFTVRSSGPDGELGTADDIPKDESSS